MLMLMLWTVIVGVSVGFVVVAFVSAGCCCRRPVLLVSRNLTNGRPVSCGLTSGVFFCYNCDVFEAFTIFKTVV